VTEIKLPRTVSPRDWLQQQRRAHGYDNRPVGSDLIAKALERLPHEAGFLIDLYAGLTRAQLDDRHIQMFLQPLIRVLAPPERAIIETVYFGLFPTFSVDAYATATPAGDRMVLVHSGLPSVVGSWAQLFLFQLEQGSWDWLERDAPEVIDLFTWIGSAWNRDIKALPRYPLTLLPKTTESWQLSSVLTHSSMAFILGHEMGHILESHKGYTLANPEHNHRMEYDADQWGLRIAIRHAVLNGSLCPDTLYAKLMLIGPFLALSTIGAIVDVQGTTHPSASSRFERVARSLRPTLLDLLGDEGFRRYAAFMDEDFVERVVSIGERHFARQKLFGEVIRDIGGLHKATVFEQA
jgi:hypothetical protein